MVIRDRNVSAPAVDHDLAGVLQAIATAVPGVVASIMVINDVLDGNISGVVLDPDEPGGGYVAEQELAPGVVYLVLGVGKLGVGKLCLLYTSPSPRDRTRSRMPSSA